MGAEESVVEDDPQLGRCEYCGDGVWPDMEYVQVRSRYWHRECAEALVADLEAVL